MHWCKQHRSRREDCRDRHPSRHWLTELGTKQGLIEHLQTRTMLHMHLRRVTDNFYWVMIWQEHTTVCEDENRCVRIPLRKVA